MKENIPWRPDFNFYYILVCGKVVPSSNVRRWSAWFEQADRHLLKTIINGVQVSTVFTALNQSPFDGPPVLWETMVFGGRLDQSQWRYTSSRQAIMNHWRVVDRIRKAFASKHVCAADQAARSIAAREGADWYWYREHIKLMHFAQSLTRARSRSGIDQKLTPLPRATDDENSDQTDAPESD